MLVSRAIENPENVLLVCSHCKEMFLPQLEYKEVAVRNIENFKFRIVCICAREIAKEVLVVGEVLCP